MGVYAMLDEFKLDGAAQVLGRLVPGQSGELTGDKGLKC
jgi:hypothetical protein